MNTSITGGYYAPLDELIREYAPNLVQTKAKEIFSINRAKGPDGEYHLYGIPLGDYHGRTLQFLNWVAESQEHFDLCAYGIQGVTWEPVGDKQFKVNSDLWTGETWTWVRNAAYERYDSNFTETDLAHIDRFHDPDFFNASVLSGFSFNSEPVSNEVSQYNVALQKYWFAIQNGAVDPEEGMALFREEAYDAVSAICAEMQSQIDAYLSL